MGNSRPGGAPATPSSGGGAEAVAETPRLRPRGGSSGGSPGRSTPLPGARERGSPVLANATTRPSSDRQQESSRAVVEAPRRLGASPSTAVKKDSVPNSLSRGSEISSGSKRRAEEQAGPSSKKPKRMDARSYIQRFKSTRRVDASAVVVASSDSMDKENTSSGHVADSNAAILCEGSRLIEKNKGHSRNTASKVSKSPISGSHETSDTRVDQCSTPFSEPHKPIDVQNIVAESSLPAKARDRRTGPARQSFLSSLENAAISTVHDEEIKSTLGDGEPISIQKENSASSSFKVTQSDGTDGNSNLCGACGLGTPGPLRSCDGKGCKSRYHMSCLNQDLSPGNWFCASCTKKRLQFGLHHIVDGIESVWDVKEVDGMQNSKQYFVKYKNLAHVHNRWVPEGDINVMPGGPDLLSLFNKRIHTEKTIWKEEWTKPHRLLRKRLLLPPKLADDSFCSDNFFCSSGVKYTYCSLEWLVKWRGLGYDHATWELETLACLCTPEAVELKKNYEDRREAAKQSSIPQKIKVKQSSFQKLQRLPDGCHPDFDNDHLYSVNHLREYWYKSRGAVLVDDKDYVLRTVLFTMSVLPDVSQPFLILGITPGRVKQEE